MEKANDFAAFLADQLATPILKDVAVRQPHAIWSFLLIFRKAGPEFGCCWTTLFNAGDSNLAHVYPADLRKQLYDAGMDALKYFCLDGLTSGATHPNDTLIFERHVVAKVQIAAHEITVDVFDVTGGQKLGMPEGVV